MPTSASQPSLADTQLVGAVLMHQFALDRFKKENKDEKLVQDAIQDSIVTCQNTNDTSRVTDSSVANSEHENTHDDNRSEQNDDSNVHYQSTAESVTCRDETVYQSFNAESTNLLFNIDQSSNKMAQYGRQLRLLAEEFEKDRKRKQVREQADQVDLSEITKENFVKFLEELFQNRITREKIVVLFFFCTDVALKATAYANELVVKLMSWSFSYIINTVCKFVHELGGWDTVLFYHIPTLIMAQIPRVLAAVGICALALFLRKSLLTGT